MTETSAVEIERSVAPAGADAVSASDPTSASATVSADSLGRAPRSVNPWLVLVVACLAQFMVVLDLTVVNVALPSVQRGLHFSAANLQWVINSYTLVLGGLLLFGGRAADLLGRRRLFVTGVIVFAGASTLNGLAQSSGMLIVGRGLQGLGAALLSPAALSIVTTTFSDAAERTKALAVWAAIGAAGAAVGLLVGGALTDLASWRWGFFHQHADRRSHGRARAALRDRVATAQWPIVAATASRKGATRADALYGRAPALIGRPTGTSGCRSRRTR